MEKICQQCRNPWNAKRRINNFCSTSCAAKWRAKNYPLSSSCFKKGIKTWNAGTNKSGMKGKKHSAETINKMRLCKLGDKAPNWRGGISSENERQRKQMRYKRWREAVFKRDSYRCQLCGARTKKGKRVELHADHIKQFALYPDLRFDVDNGRTLCVNCHKNTDTYGNTGKKAVLENAQKTPQDRKEQKGRRKA